jgi:hypothetical protein
MSGRKTMGQVRSGWREHDGDAGEAGITMQTGQ